MYYAQTIFVSHNNQHSNSVKYRDQNQKGMRINNNYSKACSKKHLRVLIQISKLLQ